MLSLYTLAAAVDTLHDLCNAANDYILAISFMYMYNPAASCLNSAEFIIG